MATRLQLLTRAGIRADMDSSGFPTQVQRELMLDEQAASLWAWMINADFPARRTTVTINATAGGGPYTLAVPGGLLRVVAVRDLRFPSSSVAGWVRRANDLERSVQSNNSAYPFATPMSSANYDLEFDVSLGPVLVMVPPDTTGRFSVECIAGHPGFAADSSSWFGPAPSEEILVLRLAAAMKEKEDPDAARHLNAKADNLLTDLWQVCKSMATPMAINDFITAEEGCYGYPL